MIRSIVLPPNVIFLDAILFFYNLEGWDLRNPDEPYYVQVAKEILESDDWLVLHLNDQIYHRESPVKLEHFSFLAALSIASISTSKLLISVLRAPNSLTREPVTNAIPSEGNNSQKLLMDSKGPGKSAS